MEVTDNCLGDEDVKTDPGCPNRIRNKKPDIELNCDECLIKFEKEGYGRNTRLTNMGKKQFQS